MTDRRQTPFDGRVAHVSLKGQVDAAHFVEGRRLRAARPVVPLRASPGGPRIREMLLGDAFRLLTQDGAPCFGFAENDGYCGYLDDDMLRDGPEPTHKIIAPRSYAKQAPGIKDTSDRVDLPFGATFTVLSQENGWSRVAPSLGDDHPRYVPSVHLGPLSHRFDDTVAVADRFLGTPYLWGGNSAFGLDCSGLVQTACHACGIACPGDSDQQQAALGDTLPQGTPPQRGDLLFWKGHVAWVSDAQTLLHANAFHVAVAYEPLDAAVARIAAQGDGPVTRHARLPS